ncbi:hypothetical protein FHG87_023556, partial [Trinorchestia longiramus]
MMSKVTVLVVVACAALAVADRPSSYRPPRPSYSAPRPAP